jgi:hypothetical protein
MRRSRLICAQRTAQLEPSFVRVIREGTTMAGAKPSSQWPEELSEDSKSGSVELESLREETKRLRQLVVQLSRIAIRNAVNLK